MEENIGNPTKKERRELKRLAKEEAHVQNARRKKLQNIIRFFLVLIALGGIGAFIVWRTFSHAPVVQDNQDNEIIAERGIHWHPILHIYIKGNEEKIPGGIGLGIAENPIHTHAADNVIHLEFAGAVRKDDLRLGRFFKVWGKQFSSACIFEFCNGQEGSVKMFVNGEPNNEFENHVMKDGDKIEIRYE